jgi:hypothetical protein
MNDTQVAPRVASREVWETVTIGEVGSVEKYREQLKLAGCKVSYWASDIMQKTPIATEAQDLALAVVSAAELGFTDWTRYGQIVERAKERGYGLCPAEVALALLLSYTDQPMNECLAVAMEALTDSDGNPNVFFFGWHDDDRWLETNHGKPGSEWSPGDSFVFVRPKS